MLFIVNTLRFFKNISTENVVDNLFVQSSMIPNEDTLMTFLFQMSTGLLTFAHEQWKSAGDVGDTHFSITFS